jgi:hypothetical protein
MMLLYDTSHYDQPNAKVMREQMFLERTHHAQLTLFVVALFFCSPYFGLLIFPLLINEKPMFVKSFLQTLAVSNSDR